MHARYYDPEAGRFIMKDPVEGSLGNPITQNSYIYCANDPINKIDPAGTTPQNTGLPPRYENEPQAVKWAGSNRTAFCTPPIANPADLLNGPIGPVASGQEQGIKLWSPEDGYGNDVWLKGDAMDTFVSCNLRNPLDKMVKGYGFEIIEVDGEKYIVAYGEDQNGFPITTVRTLDGKKNT